MVFFSNIVQFVATRCIDNLRLKRGTSINENHSRWFSSSIQASLERTVYRIRNHDHDHHHMMTMTICRQLWVSAAGCVDTGSILHPPHQLPPKLSKLPKLTIFYTKSPNFRKTFKLLSKKNHRKNSTNFRRF